MFFSRFLGFAAQEKGNSFGFLSARCCERGVVVSVRGISEKGVRTFLLRNRLFMPPITEQGFASIGLSLRGQPLGGRSTGEYVRSGFINCVEP